MNTSVGLQDVTLLLGRILLVVLFVSSGIEKLTQFQDGLAEVKAKSLPFPAMVLSGTIALQLATSFCVLVGVWTEAAALALAVFTLATAMIFYPFWKLPLDQRAPLRNGFLEHISIIGGCLLLVASGPGKISL